MHCAFKARIYALCNCLFRTSVTNYHPSLFITNHNWFSDHVRSIIACFLHVNAQGTWIRADQTSLPWVTGQVIGPDPQGFSRRLIPAHSDASATSWYSATISELQPSTYYVVQLRAVAPSGSGDRAVATPIQTWESRESSNHVDSDC